MLRFSVETDLEGQRKLWKTALQDIDLARLNIMIDEVANAITSAYGRDKVLLIGSTGAGKSTLLNYLQGCIYKSFLSEAGSTKIRLFSGSEVSRTSSDKISHTLYPQVVSDASSPYVCCDLAGLFDNRGKIYRICAANSLHMLNVMPGGIKQIILVFDLPGIEADKGASFRNVLIAVAKIVQSNQQILDNLSFIITKIPSGHKITVQAIIDEHIDEILQYYLDLKESEARGLSNDEVSLVFMLQNIRLRKDQFIIANLENEFCRKEIKIRLDKATPGSSNQLNFLDHEPDFKRLLLAMKDTAKYYVEIQRQIKILMPQKIATADQSLKNVEARIRDNETDISNFNDNMSQLTRRLEDIKRNILGTNKFIMNIKKAHSHGLCENCTQTVAKLSSEVTDHEKSKASILIDIDKLNVKLNQAATEGESLDREKESFVEQIEQYQQQIDIMKQQLHEDQSVFDGIYRYIKKLNLDSDQIFLDFCQMWDGYNHSALVHVLTNMRFQAA